VAAAFPAVAADLVEEASSSLAEKAVEDLPEEKPDLQMEVTARSVPFFPVD
jgi:hypothetical protein